MGTSIIEFDCEKCGKHLKTPKALAGRKSKCPHCGIICTIPGLRFGSPNTTAPPPPASSEPTPTQPQDDAYSENIDIRQCTPDSPEPDQVEWYYQLNGAQAGPISSDIIIEMLESGNLEPSTSLWREGLESWVTVDTAPEFAAHAQAAETDAAPPSLSAAESATPGLHKQRIILACIAGLGMLATFLPWVRAPIIGAVDGTAGDGWITFVLFGLSLCLVFTGKTHELLYGGGQVGAAICTALGVLLGIWKLLDLNAMKSDMARQGSLATALAGSVQIGFGIYLVVLAGIAFWVVCFMFPNNSVGKQSNLQH